MQTSLARNLDRWVERGLISSDQRAAILAFERERAATPAGTGPSLLASAVSTVGAAIAIAATVGIIALLAEDWSSAQAMVAATIGAVVMFAAAWQLVRNGWGAPGGVFTVCGLVLVPLALGFAADVLGWWPEETPTRQGADLDRAREKVAGVILLLSILPGLAPLRLRLRQTWAALPVAIWFGATLQVESLFQNAGLIVGQVVYGALIAWLAIFVWRPEERERGAAWWLQLGGLLLVAAGIAASAGEDRAIFPLLGVLAAALVFTVGMVRDRTAWKVAGALPAVFPLMRLIFGYVHGLAALLVVAVLGLTIALLPLTLWKRGRLRFLWEH